MKTLFNRFIKNESGATAIEYGLLAGLLSVAIVVTLQLMGPRLNGVFQQVLNALPVAGG